MLDKREQWWQDGRKGKGVHGRCMGEGGRGKSHVKGAGEYRTGQEERGEVKQIEEGV